MRALDTAPKGLRRRLKKQSQVKNVAPVGTSKNTCFTAVQTNVAATVKPSSSMLAVFVISIHCTNLSIQMRHWGDLWESLDTLMQIPVTALLQ